MTSLFVLDDFCFITQTNKQTNIDDDERSGAADGDKARNKHRGAPVVCMYVYPCVCVYVDCKQEAECLLNGNMMDFSEVELQCQ